MRKSTVKIPLFLLPCSLQRTTYYMYCIYTQAPLRLISKCTQENHPSQTHQKTQSQIKGDQLDPPVVIWVLKNNITSQQELDVGWPVSLVKRQVRVVWGFHTPAQRSRLHSLTPSMLHKPTKLHIPVSISFFFFLSFLFGVSSSCASKNHHQI